MVINHWWKGEVADLISSETVLIKITIGSMDEISFVIIIEKIRIADEMDWIIRYFILISVLLRVFWDLFPLNIRQYDKVFNSKAIQIIIQELTRIHRMDEDTRTVFMIIRVLISCSNCKFDFI
jgi:hypothetical protein